MIVIAAGRTPHDRDRLAAIDGTKEGDVRDIDGISVAGVYGDPTEVPGPAGEAVVRVGESPVLAGVVGDVEAGDLEELRRNGPCYGLRGKRQHEEQERDKSCRVLDRRGAKFSH